jgi:acetyl esterase
VTDLSSRTASYAEFGEAGLYLTAAQMDWYEHHYLGRSGDGTTEEDPTDPLISPLCAPDLTGLAPAYVAVAGFDPLRDEGEAYAARLEAAGVPVTLRRHRGLVHPFVNSVALWAGARRAMLDATTHLRTTLGTHG